jgi:hypothetical protein
MNNPEAYHFSLSICPETKTITKKQDGKVINFQHPVATAHIPKIYVISGIEGLYYIGYASSGMSKRLRNGLTAKGKQGYHGYPWREEATVDLFVFVFEPFSDGDTAQKELFVKSVEAELAYLVRHHTGAWPAFQREIHFSNFESVEAKRMASHIYNAVQNKV